ncbi:hypothetical protein CEQ90_08480 [Lewinellaceae bacterium SD302]|nr:hypothetical protein CEQ90_08480 [Lewinellaceae bacterium SD302]
MLRRSKNSTYDDRRFELFPGAFVPLRVYQENRNGYRASIGKKQLIFRLPRGLREADRSKFLLELGRWARETYSKDPGHFEHLLPQSVPAMGVITVMETEFRVKVGEGNGRKSHFATLAEEDDRMVFVELAGMVGPDRLGPIVETLVSRLMGQLFLPKVSQRVAQLNAAHFRQPVSGVTLKLTKSQWGSCSNKGKINLSSRLLLAPKKVMDAVIVHELAHRIEMNHSDRFWKLVHDAMPDYEEQHGWLKVNGRSLSFLPK